MNFPNDSKYLASVLAAQRISIRGARTHNLKNIDLDIPRNQLVVITGLSGSGKSSLAFDTLYAEGQRRYVESLSTYARQFLQLMDKPDVDMIEGLSPAISIEQKATSHNPRSTVGTVTEIHDYLRLLFARAGTPYCPEHDLPLQAQSVAEMVDAVLALPEDTRLMILAPVARERKGEFVELFAEMQAQGYVRFRVDGATYEFDDLPKLKKTEKHTIDVVIDRVKVRLDKDSRPSRSRPAAAARAAPAPGRELRGRAAAGRRPGGGAGDGLRQRAPVQRQVRLPGLQLLAQRAGAAPVLVQLAGRRLPELRRPGPPGVFRPGAGGGLSVAEPGQRRGQGLGPAQCATTSPCSRAWPSTTSSTSTRRSKTCPRTCSRWCCTARARKRSSSATSWTRARRPARRSARSTRSKASSPTSSAATARPTRRWCAKNWRATAACSPAPTAAARACGCEARHVFLVGTAQGEGAASPRKTIYEISHLTLRESFDYFSTLSMHGAKAEIAAKVVREIGLRLKFLNDVGLNYLSLDRSAETLSGGESQRIRLASQIGSGLTGVMYVLDEPSIGLHQRDNDRLIGTLKHLRDIGNSVLVVEHDEDMIRAADHVIDMGPGAGIHGGRVMAQGTFEDVQANPDSLTGQYLAGTLRIAVPKHRTPWLPTVKNAERRPTKPSRAFAPSPAAERRAAREAAHQATLGDMQALRVDQRHRPQPPGRERGVPGRPADLRDRRVRLGQIDAGQRHAVRRRGAHAVPRARRARAAREPSRASSISTRSSTSTSRRSAARRAATRPPTPACSRRSAS